MAFGQQGGPPASGKQVQELLGLLQEAGHSDFRDARGPMGFTQRQAAGKFTRDEATALIEQLLEAEAPDSTPPGSAATATVAASPPRPQRLSATENTARGLPTDVLAAELQRRGWIVVEP